MPRKPSDSQSSKKPIPLRPRGIPRSEPETAPEPAAELPFFDRRLMERQMMAMRRALEEQNFETVDEANAFLQQFTNIRDLPPAEPRTPLEEAQEVIYEALEATGARRARLARKALTISPDCAEAYVLLAEMSHDPKKARGLYEQGVPAGERALGKEIFEALPQEDEPGFWSLIETRPYMRALQGLAEVQWRLGEHDAAIGHAKELLRLNPGDNQGIRYLLVNWLLIVGDDEAAGELLAKYPDEWSASWAFTEVLHTLRRSGPGRAADQALEHAMEVNPHVPFYLLGLREPPKQMPNSYGMGDENEAIVYLMEGAGAWVETPNAITWLMEALIRLAPKPRTPPRRAAKRKPAQRPKHK
jgi:tetratricopeptide (TPR) repeat protein